MYLYSNIIGKTYVVGRIQPIEKIIKVKKNK